MVFKWLKLKAARYIKGLPVFFITFLFTLPVQAQDSTKEEPAPEGMEVREIGQTKVRIPKGMKLTGGNGVIIQEDLAEYVAREISNMQEDIVKVKLDQDELKNEIVELKKVLESKSKDNLVTKEKPNAGG
jgi:hypothetical protein